MNQPSYFDKVRLQAEEDWRIWADDRHGRIVRQLFRQVQSPKHVLSELLQNADDAGAKVASITITEGNFIFSHDGQDFDEDQFASICSFAVSSKKTIHTIGFRGIGFKSTFSLGSSVFLSSPTLAVRFDAEKFTLPHWEKNLSTSTLTTIAVPKIKAEVIDDLLQNFSRWSREPYSLLFQKSVRRLELPSQVIDWHEIARPAPVGCTWFKSREEQDACLVIRSAPAPFPEEAESEISEERELATTDGSSLPPCTVDLILGAPGRIYVALPTDVETNLPFAVNGPFIQDPGRFGIKPPSTSPTNKWLLERAGVLAAETMLSWLRDDSLGLDERASAYELMPSSRGDRDSLANQVEGMIAEAFWARLEGEAFVLLSDGSLGLPEDSLFVANELHGIWPDDWLPEIAGHKDKHLCSSSIPKSAAHKLSTEVSLPQVTRRGFASRLKETRPAKPKTFEALTQLWKAVHGDVKALFIQKEVNIVPTEDTKFLRNACSLKVLPDKPAQIDAEEWSLISEGILSVSVKWAEYVRETNDPDLSGLWDDCGLSQVCSPQALISDTSSDLAREGSTDKWIMLAHICAKLNMQVPDSLRYVSSDQMPKSPKDLLCVSPHSLLAKTLLPEAAQRLLLDEAYWDSWTKDLSAWDAWVSGPKSKLKQWLEPTEVSKRCDTRKQLEKRFPRLLRQEVSFPYVSYRYYREQVYVGTDFEFPADSIYVDEFREEFLRHNLLQLIARPEKEWASLSTFVVEQSSSNGYGRKRATLSDSRASWIVQCSEAKCLQDQDGVWRRPGELFVKSQQTEHLDGMEPFLNHCHVNDGSLPLLILLGVNTAPRDVTRLFGRLEALSSAINHNDPDQADAYKDESTRILRMIEKSLPFLQWKDDYGLPLDPLRDYRNLPLILTERHGWKRPSEAFRRPGSVDLPDTPLVLQDLRSLDLWDKLGVREEPDFSDVLKYVASIPSGVLAEDDARRVESCIARNPNEIWTLGKWFNCEGLWVATSSLRYQLTKESGIKPSELMPQFRRTSADLTKSTCSSCQLPDLLSRCEVKFEPIQAREEEPVPRWLALLTERLCHVLLENDVLQQRVREKASVLSKTFWVHCRKISRVQLIQGDQVFERQGTSKVFWDEAGKTLFLTELDEADEAEEVGRCLSEALGWVDLRTIIAYCCGRSEDQVVRYVMKRIQTDESVTEAEDHGDNTGEGEESDPVGSVIQEEGGRPLGESSSFQPSRTHGQYQPRVKVQKHERGKPGRLIEDYAEIEGFEYASENVYSRASDGHILQRRRDENFPWCIVQGRETLMQIYPLMERLGGSEGVTISYERRRLLERKPDYFALLIQDEEGDPLLLTGSELLKREQAGEITCHIAEYRLRSKRED